MNTFIMYIKLKTMSSATNYSKLLTHDNLSAFKIFIHAPTPICFRIIFHNLMSLTNTQSSFYKNDLKINYSNTNTINKKILIEINKKEINSTLTHLST